MKFIKSGLFILIAAAAVSAQKGVDTQTKKINQESYKTVQTTGESTNSSTGRVFDFGKDKTPERIRLANPQRITARREMLVDSIIEVLKEKKLMVDESSSRLAEGIIITQPFVFARGTVITQNEINRYAVLPTSDAVWMSGRYNLRIDVEPLDTVRNSVSVSTKIEGKSGQGLSTEWITLQSSGAIEDEILRKIVENVSGVVPEESTKQNPTADSKTKPDNKK